MKIRIGVGAAGAASSPDALGSAEAASKGTGSSGLGAGGPIVAGPRSSAVTDGR